MINNIYSFIQARMSSTRYPGKTLTPINGVPLLQRVFNNSKRIVGHKNTVILSSEDKSDDPIAAFCKFNSINCFRGSQFNVLQRFVDATYKYNLTDDDYILRLTADNPILKHETALKLLENIKNGFDYIAIKDLSHVVPECIKVSALRKIIKSDLGQDDYEHVTPFFRSIGANNFKVKLLENNFDGLKPEYDKLFTVDTFDDHRRLHKFLLINEKITNSDIYTNIKDSEVVNLDGRIVGSGISPYIIAEIGQNHNGSINIAKDLIDIAIKAGADAVKFQKRDIESELTLDAYNKPYINENSFGKTYGEHREFLELNIQQHEELKNYCTQKKISYFCTPCDLVSLENLEKINTPFYKVASRDLTNDLLLHSLSKIDKPVILSTGMSSMEETEYAFKILNKPSNKIVLMQCTSTYPCSYNDVNLNAIESMASKFNCNIGYSDHTIGSIASIAAVAKGACVIEKHITLDRTMKGTDQVGSIESEELHKFVQEIHNAFACLGSTEKTVATSTSAAQEKLRRSITSKLDIVKGTVLTETMCTLKSPGTGLLWKDLNKILGKVATKDIPQNQTLIEDDFA